MFFLSYPNLQGTGVGGNLFRPFSKQMVDSQKVQVWTFLFKQKYQLCFCTELWDPQLSCSLPHISKHIRFHYQTLICKKNDISKPQSLRLIVLLSAPCHNKVFLLQHFAISSCYSTHQCYNSLTQKHSCESWLLKALTPGDRISFCIITLRLFSWVHILRHFKAQEDKKIY